MPETIETINNRRSVRFYEDRPLENDKLEQIINAGNNAPSGSNTQAWRFVVVNDEVFRGRLAELAKVRYLKWMENAPERLKEMRKGIDEAVSDPVYYSAPSIVFVIGKGNTSDMDCPMVCQNIMLSARSMGIGSCWVFFGQLVLDDADIRKALDLQADEKVYGPILLGYPKGGFPDSPPKKEPQIKWI